MLKIPESMYTKTPAKYPAVRKSYDTSGERAYGDALLRNAETELTMEMMIDGVNKDANKER